MKLSLVTFKLVNVVKSPPDTHLSAVNRTGYRDVRVSENLDESLYCPNQEWNLRLLQKKDAVVRLVLLQTMQNSNYLVVTIIVSNPITFYEVSDRQAGNTYLEKKYNFEQYIEQYYIITSCQSSYISEFGHLVLFTISGAITSILVIVVFQFEE